ncbi:hypothetical protein DSO57_1000314 [Entomophthora muscae]|uniref:Uncharacterized protein n=1 Tax=Entomophthora muscae TaxID=34485 RepID=A0ACC2TKL1_9FUNG|nr:hypothetical protein DSO57_1000314 [Entomophthora muscae]
MQHKSKKSVPSRKPAQKNNKPYSSTKAKKVKISDRDLTELIDSQQVQLLNLSAEEALPKPRNQGISREQKIQVCGIKEIFLIIIQERKELAYRKAQEYAIVQKKVQETFELFEKCSRFKLTLRAYLRADSDRLLIS